MKKKVKEKKTKEIPAHQQRVITECDELFDRIAKLLIFFDDPIFNTLSRDERHRLIRQHGFVTAYYDILCERVLRFI